MGLHLADYERKRIGYGRKAQVFADSICHECTSTTRCCKWETTILDLSLNGALVEEPQNFIHSGDAITLSFILPESDIEIRMETELVHQKNAQLGLKCNFIDVDSISHLKRMVELNLGDASLLNRELMLFIEKHNIAD